MSTIIKLGDQGLPKFETESFTVLEPISGHSPENTSNHAVDPAAVAAGPMPIFSVVGVGANGLTYAKYDKSVQALGITVAPVDQGATGANVAIFRDGTFNPLVLTWDASYDTDAKKTAAFDGAPSPTAIYIKKPLYTNDY